MNQEQETSSAGRVDFVRTGPGTLGGRYLRRWWQPVYLSRDLQPERAVPIKILGERFTLYRGDTGTAHLVAHACAHRLTQLSTGWVEGDSIRCRYHGWRYESTGQCVEQPAEPTAFCQKVQIASYPVEEDLGLVFAYLGEGTPPPFERWSEVLAPGNWRQHWATSELIGCNYFQSAENIMDDVHVNFSHAGTFLANFTRKTLPRVTAVETNFGLTQLLDHPDRLDKIYFLMPNRCYLAHPLTNRLGASVGIAALFFYVPIDDVTHLHTRVLFSMDGRRNESVPDSPVRDRIEDVLSGRKTLAEMNGHPQVVRIQDGAMICGQGEIADRSQERLGRSDTALILLRKLWTRELQLLHE
ncbi:MAG TPA: Rieske 2Fe-2S domain-containing protein, partial [Kofleriaceae bacterium]|nr:Rieske 2Fe-2S domain-containing protein [Kofleriaceae bacterium]